MTTKKNPIVTTSCADAEEILASLQRTNLTWGNERHVWVFRGHENDEYELVPKALRRRPPADLGYTYKAKSGPQPTNAKQIQAEFDRLHEFYWTADAQGLYVPGDTHLLRTP